MTFVRRIRGAWVIGAAMMFGGSISAPQVQAAYTLTLQQKVNDVVATGAGTIDLTDLASPAIYTGASASMSPTSGLIIIGPVAPANLAIYPGITGPTSFGSGISEDADSGSGDLLGVLGSGPGLLLPEDYVSGDTLSSNAIWANQTFSSLGVRPAPIYGAGEAGRTRTSSGLRSSRARRRFQNLPVFCSWRCRLAS